jgi:NAD-dependent SIR2 family protein deacetylase
MMDQKTYECRECKKQFNTAQMEFEKVPENMSFSILGDQDEIPKCPQCGILEFFGFKIIDIAY